MAHTLSLRPATEADVPRLLDLWHEAMSPHFSAANIPAPDERPLHRLLMRFECAEVISLEGSLVGLLKVARDGKEWKLVQILLSPSAQRRGIGTGLISKLIAEAQTCGASLSLSVLRKNPALDLYLRLGFVIVEEEEHAINMHLGANPAVQGTLRDKTAPRP